MSTPTPADLAPKPEGDANGAPKADEETAPKADGPARLPDDHPLVTAYARQKSENETLREKARRLDEIEEANKSEIQKATERAEAAEAALAASKAEALRLSVAAKHGITGDYLDLLHGADEESLEAVAQKLAPLINKAPSGPVVPTQGDTPSKLAGGTTADAFAAAVEPLLNS